MKQGISGQALEESTTSQAADAGDGARRALWMCLALACAAPALGGCSFVFSEGPPASTGSSMARTAGDCSTSKVPPVLDTIFTGLQVARTGLALAADERAYKGSPLSQEADIGIGLGLTALFLGSAIYGYSASSSCSDVKSDDAPHAAMDTSGSERWSVGPSPRIRAAASAPEAIGFMFGASKEEAVAACRRAGLEWSDDGSAARCSGTPTQGIPGASAGLEFPGGRLTAVELVINPPNDAQGWAKSFRGTEAALIRLFGKPDQRSFVVPDECKAPESFLGCVTEGKVPGGASWSLADGRSVALSIAAAPPPSTLRVRLSSGQPKT